MAILADWALMPPAVKATHTIINHLASANGEMLHVGVSPVLPARLVPHARPPVHDETKLKLTSKRQLRFERQVRVQRLAVDVHMHCRCKDICWAA